MLVKPPLEKLLPHVENRYTLAITVAKRTRQLVSGAQPLAESESPNLVTLACEELNSGRLVAVPDLVEPYIPLLPEVEAALLASRQTEEDTLTMDMFMNTEIPAEPTPEAVEVVVEEEA